MPSTLPPHELQLLKNKIKDIRFALLTTQEPDGDFHTRPMYTHDIDPEGTVWFFTYDDSRKVREIRRNPQVGISYADHNEQTYVTVGGTAQVVKDPAKTDELWIDGLKAWFPEGKDSPRLALLRIRLHQGEYWDKPGGKLNNLFQMAKAALTGEPDRSGRNEKFGNE